jgi:type II secretory pathway predicted ATPase ExeA
MFLDYYNLREQPFGVTPDPRFLFLGESHREALASLHYGVESGRGFVSLVAPPGMGKTTLLYQLMERIRTKASTAFLFQTQCTPRDLLRYLLADMKIENSGDDLVEMHQKLNEALVKIRQSGSIFVLVIDEAQNLDDTVLETVRLLSDFETSRTKLMQIVLAGQPQLEEKLASPNLVQLRQRVSTWARLAHLSAQETSSYIDHRLSIAGGNGRSLFSPEARRLIAAYSGGIPRNINTICFNALSLGYASGRPRIEAPVIREVSSDLSLDISVPPKPAIPVVRANSEPRLFSSLAPAPQQPAGGTVLRIAVLIILIVLGYQVWPSVATNQGGTDAIAPAPSEASSNSRAASKEVLAPSHARTGRSPVTDRRNSSSSKKIAALKKIEQQSARRPLHGRDTPSAQAPKGEIVFETNPPGLNVFIDAKPYGQSPVRATIPAGIHTYRVVAPEGAQPAAGEFELQAATVRIQKVQWPAIDEAVAAAGTSQDKEGTVHTDQ